MYHKKDEFASKPASKIRKWIEGGLADKCKLERRQTFVKKEVMIDDVLTFIEMLWTRQQSIDFPARYYFFYYSLYNLPYAMRVGAGGRLDGPLTSILSNRSWVFEKSYQPRYIRENLARVAYGDLAG
ncbi:hypothetical protein Cob_v007580 [Colletotrichum orbiculare MAFF 240422]|uniref:Uncharacterized protein n=1 Tax=Colletotrichum orbiculare (strain 104-T / ATCC 96160 / CBS 514.97 / LARS 414 / MAFF 240422) TaxID=1213857 RepID=A0A484FNF2_COLOR|nr:hypothetical protein Cob_v007580 [Colletotrichum orbiculare MAFF 240422]